MTARIRYVESYALTGSIPCVDGTTVVFVQPPENPEGGRGVREPRRPKPTPSPTTMAKSLSGS